EEIFERMGKAAVEYKYDGLRVQAHVSPKRIELFSRHLENITGQFPEIVDGLRSAIKDRAAIVEGEAVPVDPNTGEFLPFQEVSRRRGRKTEVERMSKEFPVTLFAFDCLLRSEEDLTARPYTERRKALEGVVHASDEIRPSTVRVTDDVKQAEAFFDEALQAGCEGLMAKALDSTYDAGGRGDHGEPDPHLRVGRPPSGGRPRDSVPSIHGTLARRQGSRGCDDREGVGRDVWSTAQADQEGTGELTVARNVPSSRTLRRCVRHPPCGGGSAHPAAASRGPG